MWISNFSIILGWLCSFTLLWLVIKITDCFGSFMLNVKIGDRAFSLWLWYRCLFAYAGPSHLSAKILWVSRLLSFPWRTHIFENLWRIFMQWNNQRLFKCEFILSSIYLKFFWSLPNIKHFSLTWAASFSF